MKSRMRLILAATIAAALMGADGPGGENAARLEQQKALEPLQDLVGQWRGVGQPQRGSNRDA